MSSLSDHFAEEKMLCQDDRTMRPFSERLREAAAHAGVPYSQTAIARSLGIKKQTVDEWMRKGRTPSQEAMQHIAGTWKVGLHWLMFEDGPMVPEPASAIDLSKDERYILRRFRNAEPQTQQVFLTLLRALGKAVVLVVLTLQMTPKPAEASIEHIQNCPTSPAPSFNQNSDLVRIVRRFLRFAWGLLTIPATRFGVLRTQ